MHIRKNICVISLVGLLTLCSCQEAPSGISDINDQIPSDTTSYIEDTETENQADEHTVSRISNIDIIGMYDKQQLSEEIIASNGGKIVIETCTDFSDVERISMYKYIPRPISDTLRQSIFEQYFGERASEVFCKDENRDIWQLGETRTGDFYKYEVSFPSDGSGDVVFNLTYRKPNLNYLDENLLDSAYESACSLSVEDAKSQCETFISSLSSNDEYVADSILAYGKNGMSPFYQVYCKRVLDRLPVNAYNDIYFFIDDYGIEKIRGSFYDVEEIETENMIISLQGAINILKENIDMIDFSKEMELYIGEISVEYVTELQVSGEHYIVPTWRFEIGQTDDERVYNRNHILAVNAFNGSLIQYSRG